MAEACKLVAATLAGTALGACFFGGLWWTVQRGLSLQQPALLFLGSLLLRTTFVLAGFYFISFDDWRNLVACLAGFVLARFIMIRALGPVPQVYSRVAGSAQ